MKIGQAYVEVDGDLTALKKSLDKAHKRVKDATSKMTGVFTKMSSGFTKVFSGIGRSLIKLKTLAVTALAGWGVTRVLGEFAEFEVALVKMGNVTKESIESIKIKIRELPAEIGTHTELMKGYYMAISAGAKDSMDMLVTSAKMSKEAHIAQGETVKGLSALYSTYEDSLKSYSDAADLLYTIEAKGITTVEELIPYIGTLANVTKAAGLSADELGAALAQVTTSGAGTAISVTQLQSLVGALNKRFKDLPESIQKYGSAMAAVKDLGFEGVLKKIWNATDGNATALQNMLGRQEAYYAILQLSKDGFGEYGIKLDEMKKKTGAMDDAWKRYKETLTAIWNTFKNVIVNQVILIGEKLAPAVKLVVEGIGRWLEKNRELITLKFEKWINGAVGGFANLIESVAGTLEALYSLKEIVHESISFLAAMGATLTDIAAAFLLLDPINAFKAGIWGLRDTFPALAEMRDKFDAIGESHAKSALDAQDSQKKFAEFAESLREAAASIRDLTIKKIAPPEEQITALMKQQELLAKETSKQKIKDEKLLAEWSEIQQTYWLTDTENQLRLLTIQHENYAKQVEDKLELERWFASEKLQIQAEAANQSIALYTQLYESTGIEEYAEKAIAEYSKVMDAAEVAWSKILDNESDVAILRLAKEQEFADKLYNIFDDIINAEQGAANERLRIIEDFTQDRIAKEGRRASETGGLSTGLSTGQEFQMTWDSYIGFLTPAVVAELDRNAAMEKYTVAQAKMAKEQERTNAELQRIAASTARTNQLAQEQAQREIQQIYEQRKREVTGQYDRLVDWLVGKQRAEWGMAEWETQFGRVAEYAAALDPTEAGFYENGLSALESMVDILMQIDRIESQQLSEQKRLADTLLSSIQTIDQTILSLKTGELSPVTSKEFFTSTYGDMLAAAIESPENIGALTSFVEQTFLPFMKSYYADTEGYATVFENVLSGFEMLKGIYGAEWMGQTLSLAGLYEVNVSDLVTYVGMIETYDINLQDFYNVINTLESQGVDLTDFYNVTGILATQNVDLSEFYNVIGSMPTLDIDWPELVDFDIQGLADMMNQVFTIPEIPHVEYAGKFVDDVVSKVAISLKGLNWAGIGDVGSIGRMAIDKIKQDWEALESIKFTGTLENLAIFEAELASYFPDNIATATSSLESFIDVLGGVPGMADLIIEKMRAGSTFEQAFQDAAISLGLLESPLANVEIAAEDAAGIPGTLTGAVGLAQSLFETSQPFSDVNEALTLLSDNTRIKITEVMGFFEALASGLGITFAGAEFGAATMTGWTSAITPKIPVLQEWVSTGWGDWTLYDTSGKVVRQVEDYGPGVPPPQWVYGAGGLTHGPGIAGELGPEYIVPTYEPQNTNFLKSVGADPEKIGISIAKELVPLITQGGKDMTINIIVDGQVINSVVKKGLAGEDTDLIEMVRNV